MPRSRFWNSTVNTAVAGAARQSLLNFLSKAVIDSAVPLGLQEAAFADGAC